MRQRSKAEMRRSGLSLGNLAFAMALAVGLAGCGGVDGSGLGDSVGDYIWGSGKPSGSRGTASALQTGSAIAPDMGGVDDAQPIAELYNKGLDNLKSGNYRTAAKDFAEVERQHPYSSWATRAILMQAYSQYMRNSYDDTTAAAKRFITLHPGHRDAAYAYYLIALSQYEQINDIRRDQTATERALLALDEVAQRFPATPYAQDAAAKAVLARDHLAGKEMDVGRYYQDKGAHLAAINRFKTVIIKYQTTSHTPEALYRLTETYLALGIQAEAQTAAAMLGHNFPSSQWYKDAFALLRGEGLEPVESRESWISKAVRSVNPFSG